jgi:deazaflavin-dependent oxidoreductase (nitroreductase family)
MPDFQARTWRLGNAVVGVLARLGIGPIELLTTRGRRTGSPHTNPVVPVEHDGKSWLVAPYGPVSWVHNARQSTRVSLRYGRATHEFVAREASADEAGPVLKRYVAVASKARSRFTAAPDAPVADFVAEAERHPVFELMPIDDRGRSPAGPARERKPMAIGAAVATGVGLVVALLVMRHRTRKAPAVADGPPNCVWPSSDHRRSGVVRDPSAGRLRTAHLLRSH